MSKRSLGVVLASVVCTAAVAAIFYFGLKGWFLSPKTSRDDPIAPQSGPPEDGAAPDASLYRPAPVSLAPASAFLFTDKPVRQVGAVKGVLQRRRAAVLRGRVLTADGKPLAGVKVSAPLQPEVGRTFTDADGGFDLAVNGGGWIVVAYEKSGCLPAQRQALVPWNDYVWLPDVVLIPPGARVGVLELPANEAPAPLQGEPVNDDDGVRRAVFLAPPGFGARVVFSDGDKPLARLTLSAAEYSVGPHGAAALPALLPPGAGYAYAVNLDADEAKEPGARETRFSKPLIHYVENFLKAPVGTVLPEARYDADRSVWVPGPVGRVVKVLGVKDGLAELDLDGKGEAAAAADLTKLGVDEAERRRLGGLYAKDQTLWRLAITSLGAWAVTPALRLPDGAVAPPWGLAAVPADATVTSRPPPALETVEVAGTHLQLCYRSDRAAGYNPHSVLEIALGVGVAPAPLRRIDLEILIAGQRYCKTFPIPSNRAFPETYVFTWDGRDACGRPQQSQRSALVRIGYVYDAPPPVRQECVLWREQRVLLGDWDARAQALGGWTLNIHHAYDPIGRTLHLGGGGRPDVEGLRQPPVVATVAGGTGVLTYNDDDQPATTANLSQPRGLAVGADGSLYIADAGDHRVRRVGLDGLISTVAGTGRKGYDGDNRPGAETSLNAPTGLAFGPDGSLYIADDGNDRVRRLRPDGELTAFAGRGGKFEYSGDGGPAVSAQLSILRGLTVGPGGDVYVAQNSFYQCVRRVAPDGLVTRFAGGPSGKADLHIASDVVAASDGVLYVADGDGHRVWRIGTDGAASVFAGTGKAGFNGDGGKAADADLNTPSGLAVGPDGSVYIADAGNQRVRRVDPNGVIASVVGKGKADSRETGDNGPASQAVLRLSDRSEPGLGRLCGLAVGPEGDLYIADVGHSSVRRAAPAFGGISDSEILVNSEDGSELYVFDGVGRHLQTLNAATGEVIHRFVYDAAWRLKEIHDGANDVTRIERDAAGRPRAVVAPDGERTTLKTGEDGRLSRITFPAGETVEMEYGAGGLLTSFKSTTGNVTRFHYDKAGMLVKE